MCNRYANRHTFLRNAICKYFSTEKKQGRKTLSSVLEAKNGGFELLQKFIKLPGYNGNIPARTKTAFRDLSYKVARALENTPDQPTYIMIRAVCGMVLSNMSDSQIVSDILSSIKFAKERYLVDKDVIITETATVLDSVLEHNQNVFDSVIDNFNVVGIDAIDVIEAMIDNPLTNDNHREYLLATYVERKLLS